MQAIPKEPEEIFRAVVFSFPWLTSLVPYLWIPNSGSERLVNMFMIMIAAVAVVTVVRDFSTAKGRLISLISSPLFIAMTIFVLSAWATCYIGLTAPVPRSLPELVYFTFIPVTVYALCPKKPSELVPGVFLAWLFALGFSIYHVILCLQTGFVYSPLDEVVHKNRIGDIGAWGAVITVAYLQTQRPKLITVVFGLGCIIIFFLSCLGANARACMASILLAAICVGALRRGKKTILVSTAVLLLCSPLIFLVPKEKQERLSDTERGSSSAAARPYYWDLSLKYILEKPITPVGYKNSAVFKETGVVIDNPCNVILACWLETGPWGALAYTVFVFAGFITAIKVCVRKTKWKEVAFLGAALLSFQIEELCRDMQDCGHIGNPSGALYYSAIGASIFLYMGLKRYDSLKDSRRNVPIK